MLQVLKLMTVLKSLPMLYPRYLNTKSRELKHHKVDLVIPCNSQKHQHHGTKRILQSKCVCVYHEDQYITKGGNSAAIMELTCCILKENNLWIFLFVGNFISVALLIWFVSIVCSWNLFSLRNKPEKMV